MEEYIDYPEEDIGNIRNSAVWVLASENEPVTENPKTAVALAK
jgi:hypothetical protein